MRWTRGRTYAVVGLMALAGAALVVVPALGSHGGDAILLTSQGGAVQFTYPGETPQPVSPTSNGNCSISVVNGGLMTISATGGAPGVNDLSLGVRNAGRNANGTPCSQIDGGESLTLTLGNTFSSRKMSGVALDLEMTGDAIVDITFVDGGTSKMFSLHTGRNFEALCATTSDDANGCKDDNQDDLSTAAYEIISESFDTQNACAAPNSSGSNNQGNDNCIWTITPGIDFTSLTIKARDVGTVSLETGTDTAFPSHFFLTNAAPESEDDSFDVFEDQVDVALDVLANDRDDDHDTSDLAIEDITDVTGVDGAAIGAAEIASDGKSILFSADAEALQPLNTDDSRDNTFTYRVEDPAGALSDYATVTVTITGVNDAPFFVEPGEVQEDTPITLDIADDVDDTAITVICSPDGSGQPVPKTDEDGTPIVDENERPIYLAYATDGTTLVGEYVDNGDGSIDFTPAADFYTDGADAEEPVGIDVTCVVSDNREDGETEEDVTFVVRAANDAPVANDDVFYIDVPQDTSITFSPITDGPGADSDIDNDQSDLSVTQVNGIAGFDSGSISGGTLTLDDSQTFTFHPAEGFVGSTSFTYVISDGTDPSNTATVKIYEVIDCGETLFVEKDGVWARYTRTDGTSGPDCVEKPYDLEIIEDSQDSEPVVKFVPREPLDGDGNPIEVTAKFSAEVSFEPLVAMDNPGGGDVSGLEYDPDSDGDGQPTEADYEPMEWCTDSTLQFIVVDGELAEVRVTAAILPEGETWCIAYKRTYVEVIDGIEVVRTIWTNYGEGDPFKRLS